MNPKKLTVEERKRFETYMRNFKETVKEFPLRDREEDERYEALYREALEEIIRKGRKA